MASSSPARTYCSAVESPSRYGRRAETAPRRTKLVQIKRLLRHARSQISRARTSLRYTVLIVYQIADGSSRSWNISRVTCWRTSEQTSTMRRLSRNDHGSGAAYTTRWMLPNEQAYITVIYMKET